MPALLLADRGGGRAVDGVEPGEPGEEHAVRRHRLRENLGAAEMPHAEQVLHLKRVAPLLAGVARVHELLRGPAIEKIAGCGHPAAGLFLVAECTERWGTRYTHDGKTIWAESGNTP